MDAWEQRSAAHLITEFGVSLAVGVVRTLRGLSESGRRLGGPQGGEPLWRRLKWGMILAARALDVRAAPDTFTEDFTEDDLVSKSAGSGCVFWLFCCGWHLNVRAEGFAKLHDIWKD